MFFRQLLFLQRYESFPFLFIVSLLGSCSKEKRFEETAKGSWDLSRMMITDGQLQETIIYDPQGEIHFNFQNSYVTGSCLFAIPVNNVLSQFTMDFSSTALIYDSESQTLMFGQDQYQNTFKVILLTNRDLVLEYYDALNFQLRKFIFVKQE